MKNLSFIFLWISFLLPALMISCKKETVPTLTTLPVTSIASISAISGGNISNNGGEPVIQRGIVWSTMPNPTTANNSKNDSTGSENYTCKLTGLTPNTTYYVRAFAINSEGTAYGDEISFISAFHLNPNLSYGSITDQDGNTYATIVIGTQEWMAENLRTSKYRNGDPIPNVIDQQQYSGLTSGAWSHYDNNSQYETPYGKLYNWYAVTDTRNICPVGWHEPTYADWTVLTNYLNEETGGRKMKSVGEDYWTTSNAGETNESGFSALPGGERSHGGEFVTFGKFGSWWTTDVNAANNPFLRYLDYQNNGINVVTSTKKEGLSVRCLKD
jgi:uncharacterized protein (TIGR02145 family)